MAAAHRAARAPRVVFTADASDPQLLTLSMPEDGRKITGYALRAQEGAHVLVAQVSASVPECPREGASTRANTSRGQRVREASPAHPLALEVVRVVAVKPKHAGHIVAHLSRIRRSAGAGARQGKGRALTERMRPPEDSMR